MCPPCRTRPVPVFCPCFGSLPFVCCLVPVIAPCWPGNRPPVQLTRWAQPSPAAPHLPPQKRPWMPLPGATGRRVRRWCADGAGNAAAARAANGQCKGENTQLHPHTAHCARARRSGHAAHETASALAVLRAFATCRACVLAAWIAARPCGCAGGPYCKGPGRITAHGANVRAAAPSWQPRQTNARAQR
jgi:hypothetical protein